MDELHFTSEEMPRRISISVEFDGQEAVGTIVIDKGAYGLYVGIEEVAGDEPVALVDLFYKSPEGREVGHGQYQIVLYDPAADTEAEAYRAVFHPHGLRFEDGV